MLALHTIEQRRPGDSSLLPKMVFAFLFIFVIGGFIYALVENGAPSVHEITIRLITGFPMLLLGRSGIVVGLHMVHFMRGIRHEAHTEERQKARKSYLIGLAKREGAWYAGSFFSLLLAYSWTPFAGHVDIFFILTIAIPLGLFLIIFLINFIADMFMHR